MRLWMSSSRGYRSPRCCVTRYFFEVVHDVEPHRRKTIKIAVTIHLFVLVIINARNREVTYVVEQTGVAALCLDLPHAEEDEPLQKR